MVNKEHKIPKYMEFTNHPSNINIGSVVYYFHNGNNWLVVPGNAFDKLSIIPITMRDIITDTIKKMHIVKCKVTGVVSIVDMHIDDYKVDDGGLVLMGNDHYRVSELNKTHGSIYFDTFRGCLGHCIDAKYLEIDNVSDYNNIDLASCIQYRNKDDETRLTGLIGSFESINNYLAKNSKEVDMRRANVIPCYKSFIKEKDMKVLRLK